MHIKENNVDPYDIDICRTSIPLLVLSSLFMWLWNMNIMHAGPFNFEAAKTKGNLPTLHNNPYSWSKVRNTPWHPEIYCIYIYNFYIIIYIIKSYVISIILVKIDVYLSTCILTVPLYFLSILISGFQHYIFRFTRGCWLILLKELKQICYWGPTNCFWYPCFPLKGTCKRSNYNLK